MGEELKARPIRAENGVGAGVWDVGPPLAIGNCDFRDFEGVVSEELDRLYRLDLVRVTGSAPANGFGLPKTNETVRVTAVPEEDRNCLREEQWALCWSHHAHEDSPNR